MTPASTAPARVRLEPGARIVPVLVLHHDDLFALPTRQRGRLAAAFQRPPGYPRERAYRPIRRDRVGGGQGNDGERSAVVGDVDVVFEERQLRYRQLLPV